MKEHRHESLPQQDTHWRLQDQPSSRSQISGAGQAELYRLAAEHTTEQEARNGRRPDSEQYQKILKWLEQRDASDFSSTELTKAKANRVDLEAFQRSMRNVPVYMQHEQIPSDVRQQEISEWHTWLIDTDAQGQWAQWFRSNFQLDNNFPNTEAAYNYAFHNGYLGECNQERHDYEQQKEQQLFHQHNSFLQEQLLNVPPTIRSSDHSIQTFTTLPDGPSLIEPHSDLPQQTEEEIHRNEQEQQIKNNLKKISLNALRTMGTHNKNIGDHFVEDICRTLIRHAQQKEIRTNIHPIIAANELENYILDYSLRRANTGEANENANRLLESFKQQIKPSTFEDIQEHANYMKKQFVIAHKRNIRNLRDRAYNNNSLKNENHPLHEQRNEILKLTSEIIISHNWAGIPQQSRWINKLGYNKISEEECPEHITQIVNILKESVLETAYINKHTSFCKESNNLYQSYLQAGLPLKEQAN
jgi:hypothetical protein